MASQNGKEEEAGEEKCRSKQRNVAEETAAKPAAEQTSNPATPSAKTRADLASQGHGRGPGPSPKARSLRRPEQLHSDKPVCGKVPPRCLVISGRQPKTNRCTRGLSRRRRLGGGMSSVLPPTLVGRRLPGGLCRRERHWCWGQIWAAAAAPVWRKAAEETCQTAFAQLELLGTSWTACFFMSECYVCRPVEE